VRLRRGASALPPTRLHQQMEGDIDTSRIPATEAELELVREYARAIEAHDADRVAELLHPEVVLKLYSADQPIVGQEAARAWYTRAFKTWIAFDGAAHPDVVDVGSVTMSGRVHWYGEGGGHDQPGTWQITFRDGLIDTVIARRP
jgi:ketosteroid isomerase-like protein